MSAALSKAPSESIVLLSYDNKRFEIHVSLKLSQCKNTLEITSDISSENLPQNMRVGQQIL